MKIINLLPPSEQDLIRIEQIAALLRKFLIISAGSYLAIVLILFAEKIYVQKNLSNLDADIAAQKQIIGKANNAAIRNQVQFANSSIADYNSIVEQNPHWSKALLEFAKLVPNGVMIRHFTASTTKKVDISGISIDRQSSLDLRDHILNSPYFANVDLPFENLQKPKNVEFHYTFLLKDGALK